MHKCLKVTDLVLTMLKICTHEENFISEQKKKDMMKYVKQKRMGDDVKSLKRVEYHFRSVLEEKVNSC